jgi:GNAT superfamily N-acetyltransferase
MSAAVTTRPAGPGDLPCLVEMMREFYAEADYALETEWAERSFRALLGDPALGAVFIVFAEGEPRGYAVLTFRHSMEFGGRDAFIDDLFVRKASRRQGLGRAVVGSLVGACGRLGILALHVETSGENRAAVALYESFGMRDRKRLLLTARLTARDERPLS